MCRKDETEISLKERHYLRLKLKSHFESKPKIKGEKEDRYLDISSKNAEAYSPLLSDMIHTFKAQFDSEDLPSKSSLRDFFQMNEPLRCIKTNTIKKLYLYLFDLDREEALNLESYTKDWAEEWKKWEGLISQKEKEPDALSAPANATSFATRSKWGWIAAGVLAICCMALLFSFPKKQTSPTYDYDFSQIISPQNIDFSDTIGQTGFYFRMRDSSRTLWPHLKVSFFNLKNKPSGQPEVWAVEAKGLYRDNKNGLSNRAQYDTMVHRGIITNISGKFYQMILRPVDKDYFEDYGYWFSTFQHTGKLVDLCNFPGPGPIGIGSGISNYKEGNGTLNKITGYVFQVNKQDISFGQTQQMDTLLREMLKKIKTEKDTTTSRLRISFN